MPADPIVPDDDPGVSQPRRAAGQGPDDGPANSTDPIDTTPRRALAPESSEEPGMGSVAGWTILGTILPGLGLWRSGRRVAGSLVMAVVLLLLGGLAAFAITQGPALVAMLAKPAVLRGVAVGLLVLAVAWVIVIGATHLALRPSRVTTGQRVAGAALVCGLSFAVAAPLAFSANIAYSASNLSNAVFAPSDDDSQSETVPTITNSVDPWAEKEQLNVLILGGDSGTGRSEKVGMRPDTVIVASIDTATGATTLFSLPRQTAQMPFPKDSKLSKYFPYGWYDGRDPKNPDYWLNAMYRFAPKRVPKGTLGKTKHLPEDIMKISVGEALGLDIDYFVTVNMDGFKDIINALGGITVNVNSPIPIGGDTDRNLLPTGWIEKGKNQHLTGRLALWYARGRWGYDDYSRMSRQRCVINAVVQQAVPENVLANFGKIAAAGEKTVNSDIPDSMAYPLLTLAKRVQETGMRSVVFINGKDGFSTLTPNWDRVRKQVKNAIKETLKANAEPTGTPTPSTTPTSTESGSASPSSKPTKSAKPKSDNVARECKYDPTDFKPKGYPGTRDNPKGYRQGR